MHEKRVMLVGFNPALQKVLFFPDFHENEVNRSESISYMHGGKGANYAKALAAFGVDSTVFQFVGGGNGEKYCEILTKEGVGFKNCATMTETRVCSTCISESTGTVTEIIEPSGRILEREFEEMRELIIELMPAYDAVAICGTFPPGVDGSFYALIVEEARGFGLPVLIDSYIGINRALERGPDFLKINVTEFKRLLPCDDVAAGVAKFFLIYEKVKVLALTDGSEEACLFENPRLLDEGQLRAWSYGIPKLDNVINPIGAGDTVGAGFLSSVLNGESYQDAYRKGLAAASASCLEKKNANFDMKIADVLYGKINLEEIN